MSRMITKFHNADHSKGRLGQEQARSRRIIRSRQHTPLLTIKKSWRWPRCDGNEHKRVGWLSFFCEPIDRARAHVRQPTPSTGERLSCCGRLGRYRAQAIGIMRAGYQAGVAVELVAWHCGITKAGRSLAGSRIALGKRAQSSG